MLAKRIFDLIASAIGLLILSPIFAIVAIWIKLDSSGPILFKQTRVGYQGQPFQICKFRTMVVNAEAIGTQITTGGDPRITKIGKFLRKYKLDELPQLFNVLMGEMSLVGPRPEVPKYVNLYNSEQKKVFQVRPGITDLASLEFRNENELLVGKDNAEEFYIQEIMPRKLLLNLEYIDRVSLLFDLKIIAKTISRIILD
jgi:lipopolysaccharide/colanic/teichoic acid biosynthesis glycosyltransferase